MDAPVIEDTLGVVGTGLGVYLALAGVASLVGMAWQYQSSGLVAAGQILGSLGLVALVVG
jgi:hypothetical protein